VRTSPPVRHASLPFTGAAKAESPSEALVIQPNALVDGHFAFIWRLLRRLGLGRADADDAVQQVFMIAMQKLDRITAGSERTFLYGIALRVASNARRAAGRRRDTASGLLQDAPGLQAAPDEITELSRAWALLDELLEQMRPELRRVLVLAEIEQIEVAEIAALEKLPLGTAASRLRRAREEFRALLAEKAPRNPFALEKP
jgi:RNA polymerase sigma-70 factor, ECF subfamily